MTERERVEEQIREVLATEQRAIPFSNKLFGQEEGLFGRLASTEAERWVVAQSRLFRQALDRLHELQQKEVVEFTRLVEQARATLPAEYVFKMEGPSGTRVPRPSENPREKPPV